MGLCCFIKEKYWKLMATKGTAFAKGSFRLTPMSGNFPSYASEIVPCIVRTKIGLQHEGVPMDSFSLPG